MNVVTKEDFAEIFNRFIRKTVAKSLVPSQKEYESSTFRQPELYGLPVFVIGYGGRTIAYLGQYIAHKIIKVKQNGKIRTRWRILTGFVRILAKHVEEDVYIELFANGVPSAGVAEWLNNRDQYILIEDREEINEIECDESDIINLSGVMNYEDPVILIDVSGLLKEMPADVLARYTEIASINKSMQNLIFEMEQIIEDLKTEVETTKAENRILRTHVHGLSKRLLSTAGTLMHYKSELLKQKELLQFYIERLEAVQEGKEKLQAVIGDFHDFMETISPIITEITEKISELEKLKDEAERVLREAERVREEKKERKGGEKE